MFLSISSGRIVRGLKFSGSKYSFFSVFRKFLVVSSWLAVKLCAVQYQMVRFVSGSKISGSFRVSFRSWLEFSISASHVKPVKK